MFRSLAFLLAAAALAAGCDTLAPEDGYRGATPSVASGKLIHWELVEHPGWSDPAHASPIDSIGIIVTFRDGVSDPEAASDSAFYGQEVRRRTYYRDSFTGVSATVALTDVAAVLDALAANPLVALVEPDLPMLQTLPLITFLDATIVRLTYTLSEWFLMQVRPWSVRHVGGHNSWTASGNGSGSVDMDVYVIDGAIRHSDIDVVERVNFLPEGTPAGAANHGTHVAGIIAAVDDGNGVVGVAPGARVHSLEVLGPDGATTLSALLDAVEFVTARRHAEPTRPMVVNMSIGRDLRTMRLNALDRALAEAVRSGVVVVVSAGNDAANAATYSPAHAPGVITVGATNRADRFAGSFSNTGSYVDILAPGEDVMSLSDRGLNATMSGTSMAAAHVSGAAALYLARHPGASPGEVLANMGRRAHPATGTPANTTTARVHVEHL